MFGYVRINKPELKVKEYEAYRGLYCSLCKAVGRYYGVLARLTLSYDITFLLLSRLSFLCMRPDFKEGRCPFNPTKRCNYCRNADEELKYAASVSMMLFYYKVKDDISDGSFFRRLFMYFVLPYAYMKNRKAKRFYPHIEKEIALAMSAQAETEKSGTAVTDMAAHQSAHVLGVIMAEGMGDKKESAYRFGYGTGKWVYLCDGADDIRKDLKRGSYNPFIIKYGIKGQADIIEKVVEDIEGQLNMSCALVIEAYEGAGETTLRPIIENIIYEGTEKVMNNILKGKNKNERSL